MKIKKSDYVYSLMTKMFSKWKYEQVISDIGNAFHNGYFVNLSALKLKKKFPNFDLFLKRYLNAWAQRDLLNDRILEILNKKGDNISNVVLYKLLIKLSKSTKKLIACLFLMGDSINDFGYLKNSENAIRKELTFLNSNEILSLLNINRQLSFYNQHIIELYNLKKKLSRKFLNIINSGEKIYLNRLMAKDRKIIDSFLKKYYYYNSDYLFLKLKSISFLNKKFILNILDTQKRNCVHYQYLFAKLRKTIKQKEKIIRITKYLKNIQTIYYYEHIFEQKRRINISLGLGDILVRYLIVKRMNLNIKSPLYVNQNKLANDFKKFIYGGD